MPLILFKPGASGDLVGGDAFQPGAFQPNAFQTSPLPSPLPPPTPPSGDFGKPVVRPLKILIGPAHKSASLDVTDKVPIDSISIEETGTHDEASASFSIIDKELLYTAMRGE